MPQTKPAPPPGLNIPLTLVLKPNGDFSSNIYQAGFDPQYDVMAVYFRSGGVYHCHPVQPEMYADFQAAESPGGWYNARIKYNAAITAVRVRTEAPMPLPPTKAGAALALPAEPPEGFDPEQSRQAALDLLARLAEARTIHVEAGEIYTRLLAEWQARPEVVEAKRRQQEAAQRVADLDGETRQAAIAYATGSGVNVVSPLLRVKIFQRTSFEDQRAINWAKSHAPVLLNLDRQKFIRHALAVQHTTPLDFVKIESVREASIASDLSSLLPKAADEPPASD